MVFQGHYRSIPILLRSSSEMPNPESEEHIAERFALLVLANRRKDHTAVARGADPPDFVMIPEGWLEVSDIYLSNQASEVPQLA